jgi:two-component system cell cycle response regulator
MLLDIDMPRLDGPATLREMKADPQLASVPVIFLTARAGADDVAAGLDLGASDYLRKPCEAVELTARVSRALRTKAQQEVLAERVQEMNRANSTDVLTGLGNRRRIEATIDQVIGMHGPDADTAVIIVDIDHFKAVNDTYGHAIGDEVLRYVAGRLRGAADDRVALARWGGEEFVLAGVGLDAAGVYALADEARRVVGATPFATSTGVTIPITVSAGCAIGHAAGFGAVLETADAALYEAKRTGRNRVRFAHHSVEVDDHGHGPGS